MADRRTPDAKLIEAVRILARTIKTEDCVIPACLAEVATRLAELVEDRRCVWTDIDGTKDFDTQCGERQRIDTDLEVWSWCPYCGGRVEERDAEDEESGELPPGPEGNA